MSQEQQIFTGIIRRGDGSYIIDRNGLPCHVPNGNEWAELWRRVDAYALAHPAEVAAESPPAGPKEPEPEQPPTREELLQSFISRIQGRLDRFAQTRNYDGILSAASYFNSTVPQFQAEGRYAIQARDLTWAKAYAVLDQVESGLRPVPAWEDLKAELPALEWPAQEPA